ncbi:MAG: hypothetical protein J5648_00675, partial [Lachnospiraceae bacterium]|nr:hypothetical protein [Lachnospiraceae bacterium]
VMRSKDSANTSASQCCRKPNGKKNCCNHPNREEYLQAVTGVFDRYVKEGFVTIANHSVAYTGII